MESNNQNPYSAPTTAINQQQGMVNCRGCQGSIHSSAATCPHCGASQRTRGYKNKYLAAVLAFFLGGFGVHRFYLGQWWGIFYLLFFWTWIPGIVAFVEMIVFLVKDQYRWDLKYNEGKSAGTGEGGGAATAIIVIVVVGFFGVAMIGILAAVALPAYQQYTIRAKLSEALVETISVRNDILGYYEENNAFPDLNRDIGLNQDWNSTYINSVNIVSDGAFAITFQNLNSGVDGDTIVFSPTLANDEIIWDCRGGSLEQQYRMPSCRSR